MTLQQVFIANLKKIRKERGYSQMTLSEKCDTSSNYIGQIEMGRRIPSLGTVEKIATALEIPCYELLMHEAGTRKEGEELKTRDYLLKMPQKAKEEIIANMLAAIHQDVKASFDSDNY